MRHSTDENPWAELDRERIVEILERTSEPLTIRGIQEQQIGHNYESTRKHLDELMKRGVVVKGPPETADGILGLVERERTYCLAESADSVTDEIDHGETGNEEET